MSESFSHRGNILGEGDWPILTPCYGDSISLSGGTPVSGDGGRPGTRGRQAEEAGARRDGLSRPGSQDLEADARRGWGDGGCTSPPRPRGRQRSPGRAPGGFRPLLAHLGRPLATLPVPAPEDSA